MISQGVFVKCIEGLMAQYNSDSKTSDLLKEAFGLNEYPVCNNSILVTTIMELLREYFPKDEDGHCDLEFYCYVLNFGKFQGGYESPEELYVRLIKKERR